MNIISVSNVINFWFVFELPANFTRLQNDILSRYWNSGVSILCVSWPVLLPKSTGRRVALDFPDANQIQGFPRRWERLKWWHTCVEGRLATETPGFRWRGDDLILFRGALVRGFNSLTPYIISIRIQHTLSSVSWHSIVIRSQSL